MSNLIARLLLSILILPVATVIYIFAMFLFMEALNISEETGFFLAGSITWLFVGLYWVGLWRSTVRWTPTRVGLTIASFPVSFVVGAVCGGMFIVIERHMDEFAIFIGSVITIVTWLIASIVLWRELPSERLERLRATGLDTILCPTCSYNMTGLRETNCPECGGKFTLEQILGSQPGGEQQTMDA